MQSQFKAYEKSTAPPYLNYNFHSDNSPRTWMVDSILVILIDPGPTNLGFRIERRFTNGHVSTEILTQVKLLECGKDVFTSELAENTTRFLDGFREYHPHVHYVCVERQMSINFKCTRLLQHIITYYMMILKDLPLRPYLMEISPFLKSRELHAPKGMNRTFLKKWTCGRARQFLIERQDPWLTYFDSLQAMQQRDVADTICMSEGLFKLLAREGIKN